MSSDKTDAFRDYLGTTSQAETWFKALTPSDKATWAIFVTAFERRWPPVTIAEKTKAEYEKELLEHVLLSTDVGKKTKLYDRECWTHVAWAAKTLQFATSAGIEQGTSMIWQVRSKLPDVVKDLLKNEEYKNWTEFAKAVMELKGSRLAEKQEQHVKQSQELMSTDNAHPPEPAYGRQPATPQQQLIITEDMRTAIRQLVNTTPQQPDNPNGQTAYANQIAQWNAKWGENAQVMHETGYPLRPGTAAIGSSECFGCGTHRHNGRNCPLPVDHAERLLRKEAAWRAITSRVLGAFNRTTATPISLVINQTPQYNTAWIEELAEQDEGKVEGGNVLACTEASRKDTNSSACPKLSPNPIVTHVPTPLDTIDAVDLYSVGHVAITKEQLEAKEVVPFIHQVILEGPKGEAVRVRALFDNGAMVAAIKEAENANGSIINSEAKWSGTIEINRVRAKGDFEVFNSGGGWAFLFGKPLLQSFKAEHNYQSDTIKIINGPQSTTIHNQVAHPQALQRAEHQGTSLTQDVKQQKTPSDTPQHHSSSSSSERNLQPTHPPTPPHTKEPAWHPSHAPMGQWKPSTVNLKQREQQ
ncbi:hypothetical protein DFH29DRAFT_1006073 [Suillus ampliporus]|nr:hypothetical protein DFH29DRAFT_1006073 [Suillus ampliporus]